VPTQAEIQQAQANVERDKELLGEGSLADLLRDVIAEHPDFEGVSVYGHRMWGHSTGNPTWRRFLGPQGEGEEASRDPLDGVVEPDRWNTRAMGALFQATRLGVTEAAATDPSLTLLDEGRLRAWIAREVPFAPFDQLVELEGHEVRMAEGLGAWLVARYREQRPTAEHY
jgi:hypothetical protein